MNANDEYINKTVPPKKVCNDVFVHYNKNMQNIKNNLASPWEFVNALLNSIESNQLQLDLFLNLLKEFAPNIKDVWPYRVMPVSSKTPTYISLLCIKNAALDIKESK